MILFHKYFTELIEYSALPHFIYDIESTANNFYNEHMTPK